MKKKGMGKFVAGALVGGALGVLFAPKKGSESREILKNKTKDAYDKVKNMSGEDVKEFVEEKIEQLKQEVADLDKEKVLKVAKEKASVLKQKADDIVQIAIEKGSPMVQKTANNAKDKIISMLNATIEKLEQSK